MTRLGLCGVAFDADDPGHEARSLLAAARERFDETLVLDPGALVYVLRRGAAAPEIFAPDGEPLPAIDALIVRSSRGRERRTALLARCLELRGTTLADPVARFGSSKLLAAVERYAVGVGVDTFVAFEPRSADALLARLEREDVLPLVAKPVDGSGGVGVARLDDRAAAEIYAKRFFAGRIDPDVPLLLERWIDFENEYRVLVAGGEAIGVAAKTPAEGEVAANARRDGAWRGVEATEIAAFARRHAAPDAILGVDIGRDANGRLYLLEANPAPLWRELERATGVDVASAILDRVLRARRP